MQIRQFGNTISNLNQRNNNPNFQSRFVNNKALRNAFNQANFYNEYALDKKDFIYNKFAPSKRNFIRAVQTILNDGKNDVIELKEKGDRTEISINGKRFGEDKEYINWFLNRTGSQWAIIDFAERERGFKRFPHGEALTKEETVIVLNEIGDVLKSEPDDLLKILKGAYDRACSKIELKTQEEFEAVKKAVFRRYRKKSC